MEQIHNSTLQAAAETGFPGVALFLGMILLSFHSNARTRRRARRMGPWREMYWGMAMGLDVGMVGFFFASQFMSVLFYPMFWVSFGLTTALAEVSRKAVRTTARQPQRQPLLEVPAIVPGAGLG